MKHNERSGIVISFLFLIFFLSISVYATIDRIQFAANSIVVNGKVVAIEKKTTSKTDRTFIYITREIEVSVITFTDAKGDSYKIEESPFLTKAPYNVGETVRVRYEKDFPESGVVDSFTNLYGYLVMFYFICFVFLLILIYLRQAMKKRRKILNGNTAPKRDHGPQEPH